MQHSTWDLGVSDPFQLEDGLSVLDEDLRLAVGRVRVEVVLLEDGLGRRAIVGHVVVGPRLAARQLVALHKEPRNNYIAIPFRISSPERERCKARKQICGRSYGRVEQQKPSNSRFPPSISKASST